MLYSLQKKAVRTRRAERGAHSPGRDRPGRRAGARRREAPAGLRDGSRPDRLI